MNILEKVALYGGRTLYPSKEIIMHDENSNTC